MFSKISVLVVRRVVAVLRQCRKKLIERALIISFLSLQNTGCLFADVESLFWFQNKFMSNPTFIKEKCL